MPGIEDAAEKLSNRSGKKEELEQKLEGVDRIGMDAVVKEEFLSKKIEPEKPGKVAGVDGGLVRKRYSAGDVVAVRAVAAVFDFGEDLEVEYVPGKMPEPEFYVLNPRDQNGLDRAAEELRLEQETGRVLDVIEDVEQVLLDGSIVPSYLEGSVENYSKILEKAGDGEFVGVVEDSYGLKLSRLLSDRLEVELGEVRDTLVMDALLDSGERSFVRKYSDSPVEHPVLQKLDKNLVNRIYTFYVKVSEKDIPLRVDYHGKPEDADRIASTLLSLKSSESYTVPSPIVEADRRAKIPEKYLKRLEKKFSPRERRRDRRVF